MFIPELSFPLELLVHGGDEVNDLLLLGDGGALNKEVSEREREIDNKPLWDGG